MNYFTVTIPATFTFDVFATSEEDAVLIAKRVLDFVPVDDEGRVAPVFIRPHLELADYNDMQIVEDSF